MSTQNENNQNDRQETLRQELLEYYFECHPDSEAMAERLASDAELAALYEEVKQTASLLEDAALSEAPPLQLTTPAIPSGPPVHSGLTFRKAWLTAAAAVAIAVAVGALGGVLVLVTIFGRQAPVELEYWQVEKSGD